MWFIECYIESDCKCIVDYACDLVAVPSRLYAYYQPRKRSEFEVSFLYSHKVEKLLSWGRSVDVECPRNVILGSIQLAKFLGFTI